MATSSSLSSSSQGFSPGVLGKWKQTPGDLIVYSLEDLKGCDFKKFKDKLSDFPYKDKFHIPRGRLENADWITTKELLIDAYGEEDALDVTIDVLTLIGLMGPAKDLRERRAQHAKEKKMTHDNRFSEFQKEYKESEKEMCQRIKDYNSRMGEAVHLKKRFTKLLMGKGPQNKRDKEQEIRSLGRRHLQIMEKRSPTTIHALFDPDEDGFIPKIVVLQGAAGIGKTMTSKKIMLDWASGDLYQDKFDFVFYLSCREINTIPGKISLVELLSRACRLEISDDLVSILKDPSSHRKLLFIVDSFDELRWTLEEKSEVCHDFLKENHKEIILQRLLRKQVLKQSFLIITTRSTALKKLKTFIENSRNVEIQGFTRDDLEEYVHKFFGNKEDADKVLSIIKDNEVLYTMCAVPITCWIVCTVMKHKIRKDLGLIRCKTLTSIYLLYLEVLITHHTKKGQLGDWEPQVLHTCLKKLCALACQGVLNQQILFEKKDLERHGLSLDEVESLFLNEDIFHWDVRTQTCYSFIHLSVQEFLAALYYGLDDWSGKEEGTSGVREVKYHPRICSGESLPVLCSQYPHLALAVQFLFGLLNEKEVKVFADSTGIEISLRAAPAIKKWAIGEYNGSFPIHAISCLYETQDEDFIRSSLSQCSDLWVDGSLSYYMLRDSNYAKQLNYCLKTLKRECFQSVFFKWLAVDPECQQKNLSPLLHQCQTVRLYGCGLTSSCCDDLRSTLITNQSLTSLDLSHNNLQDSGLKNLCDGLREPGCTLQALNLSNCKLSPLCCDDLHSVLITNGSLTTLDVSMNCLQDSGIKRLCGGLMDPRCVLQELSLSGCNLPHFCCDDLQSVLINNRSLTKLDLSYNYLQCSGIKLLCEGLQHPDCPLQELSLCGCDLTHLCCDDLCSVLITNRSLTKLDLSENGFQDSGIKVLCGGLQHPNCTLQQLRVWECKMTLSCRDDLRSVITTNQTLTRLEVELTADEKMSKSEVDEECEVFRNLGCSCFSSGHQIRIAYMRDIEEIFLPIVE